MDTLITYIQKLRDIIFLKRSPVAYARSLGVKVGNDVRLVSIRPGTGTFGSEPYLISIGDHVTIAGAVQFVNHYGGVWVFRDEEPNIDVFGSIVIERNVFVGYGAILMPGVNVGENVVIGAGAVVTKDIPANSVAAGIPAKIICSRDEYYKSISIKKEFVKGYSEQKRKEYLIRKYMHMETSS